MADTLANLRAGLIVTRTPVRVSFVGGGTDLKEFYDQEPGAVLSTTIDKYVYVTVRPHGKLFAEKFRINYSETEQTASIDAIKNDIIRECLRLLEIDTRLYISVVSDLPAASGLGSSSSFAVGLLNALHTYKGERVSASQLAQEACFVEIDVLKHPIGKQDQYAAAFGGLNFFSFAPGGGVTIEPQRLPQGDPSALFSCLMMFWTGITREANSVLVEQKRNTDSKRKELARMRDHAVQMRTMLSGEFRTCELGKLLDETWQLKRGLASTVSSDQIDGWYQRARTAGASGGKILGAGAGGFLLLVVEPPNQQSVREALSELNEIVAGYEAQGSSLLLPSV